jgi:hypothetical protein
MIDAAECDGWCDLHVSSPALSRYELSARAENFMVVTGFQRQSPVFRHDPEQISLCACQKILPAIPRLVLQLPCSMLESTIRNNQRA